MATLEVRVYLGVDDKTRHWVYGKKRDKASRHKSDSGGGAVPMIQPIYNGRGKGFVLDEASFELIDIPTELSTEDFYSMKSNSDLQAKYHAEVEAAMKKKLGCDKILFLQHQVRNASKMNTPGVAGYAGGGPHTDSSPVSADALALNMLRRAGDSTPYKRYLYLNLWRNISEDPIENDHLAVLDERTTAKPDDYIAKDFFAPNYSVVQYSLNARHAKNHKWHYFPSMQKNEGILFKQFDSDFTLSGRICFHMAVNDPSVPYGAKPRESIELRMLCFWKEAAVDSMPTMENTNLSKMQDPEKLALEYEGSYDWSISGLIFNLAAGSVNFVWRTFWSDSVGYTGNPKDYIKAFSSSIEHFSHWPQQAKDWVSGLIKTQGEQQAIKTIVRNVVEDASNHHGTKMFVAEQKQAIADALLADDTFMSAARKHLLNSRPASL